VKHNNDLIQSLECAQRATFHVLRSLVCDSRGDKTGLRMCHAISAKNYFEDGLTFLKRWIAQKEEKAEP